MSKFLRNFNANENDDKNQGGQSARPQNGGQVRRPC